jgi:hypothetical protein
VIWAENSTIAQFNRINLLCKLSNYFAGSSFSPPFFLTPSLILRQWSSRFVIPVREWALLVARRSIGITNLRAIKPDSVIWKHPTIPFPYVTRRNNLYPACYSWSKATRDLLAIRVQESNPFCCSKRTLSNRTHIFGFNHFSIINLGDRFLIILSKNSVCFTNLLLGHIFCNIGL